MTQEIVPSAEIPPPATEPPDPPPPAAGLGRCMDCSSPADVRVTHTATGMPIGQWCQPCLDALRAFGNHVHTMLKRAYQELGEGDMTETPVSPPFVVSGCDAPEPKPVYLNKDNDPTCRCVVCARCGHHTGNSNQGHYWSYCGVTRTLRKFHFCCPGDCELGSE